MTTDAALIEEPLRPCLPATALPRWTRVTPPMTSTPSTSHVRADRTHLEGSLLCFSMARNSLGRSCASTLGAKVEPADDRQ